MYIILIGFLYKLLLIAYIFAYFDKILCNLQIIYISMRKFIGYLLYEKYLLKLCQLLHTNLL